MWRPPTAWSRRLRSADVEHHLLDAGSGLPVVLLHGWPEYCGVWRRLIPLLAPAHRLIAPDLRGFGYSRIIAQHPHPILTPSLLTEDLTGLLDLLGLERVAIVSHDVGAFAAQLLARTQPNRVAGLVFFDCPHPQIGARYGLPEHQVETWYQQFQRLPLAEALVGYDRDTCRLYLAHFLGHLAAQPDAFDEVLDEWVEIHMQPGVLRAGFSWYEGVWPARRAMMEGRLPSLPPIAQPTRILWGAQDPITPLRWADRLDEAFVDFELTPVPEAGHFPHWEKAELVAPDILRFLARLPW